MRTTTSRYTCPICHTSSPYRTDGNHGHKDGCPVQIAHTTPHKLVCAWLMTMDQNATRFKAEVDRAAADHAPTHATHVLTTRGNDHSRAFYATPLRPYAGWACWDAQTPARTRRLIIAAARTLNIQDPISAVLLAAELLHP